MWSLLSWLGVLAGGVSVFRLCHLWYEFDLSVPGELALTFYRQFFHQLVGWMAPLVLIVARWFGVIELPAGWQDR